MPRVNYDLIAPLYDEPERDHPLDLNLLEFLKGMDQSTQVRVLDVGCGTGKQLAADQKLHPQVALFGLDYFSGMLKIAKTRCPAAAFTQADGSHMPFRNTAFDYVTSQFSYHHLPEKEKMFAEVYRVLRPGGRFTISNIDPWAMKDWFVYRFFPTSLAMDSQAFLPVESLVSTLQNIGFASVQYSHSRRETQENLADVLVYAKKRYRTSQLMAISDDDYQHGIQRIEGMINSSGKLTTIPSLMTLIVLTADKPR